VRKNAEKQSTLFPQDTVKIVAELDLEEAEKTAWLVAPNSC
jgi:hypothetical protein